jgi:uncharacterized protein
VRFWDSSAVAALLVEESRSVATRELLTDDRELAAWWGSRVECISALRRRERAGALDRHATEQALALLEELSDGWYEVLPGDALRVQAERALAVHPLRAADALQLAAALTWRGSEITTLDFVCLDERLRDAASREGFRSLPATP